MTITLAQINRHPIKSHGRESLASVVLSADAALPWDRRWAVTHEASRTQPGAWAPCANFSRGSKAPRLMAISARLDEAAAQVTLSHPDRPDLTFRPDDGADTPRFLDWVLPLCPSDRAQPVAIAALPGRGFTDTDYASVSLINLASNAALGAAMGTLLSPLRWRGNLWLEGLAPWAEFDLIGRRLVIGEAVLEVTEPIVRCRATTANPATGVIDADTLAALNSGQGHQNFGIYARVVAGGRIGAGDRVQMQ